MAEKKSVDFEKSLERLEELVEERTSELLQANRDLETEVNERRRAEEVIKASLQEKEVMLS